MSMVARRHGVMMRLKEVIYDGYIILSSGKDKAKKITKSQSVSPKRKGGKGKRERMGKKKFAGHGSVATRRRDGTKEIEREQTYQKGDRTIFIRLRDKVKQIDTLKERKMKGITKKAT